MCLGVAEVQPYISLTLPCVKLQKTICLLSDLCAERESFSKQVVFPITFQHEEYMIIELGTKAKCK